MTKYKKMHIYDYYEFAEATIKKFGLVICPICGKSTLPIIRKNDEDFYYFCEVKDCSEHSGFDLIFGNTEEGRKLFLYERLN